MSIRYTIDKERRLVVTIGQGCVSPAEIRNLRNQALSDPGFDREFNEIVDFRAVTLLDMNGQQVRELAETEIFSPNSKIALVSPNPGTFGTGRMYGIYNEMSKARSKFYAFYDLPSALKWLGLNDLDLPISAA